MKRADADTYRAQGFGHLVGIGARPALCVVDFVNGFVDPAIFGGGNIAQAVAQTVGLLAAARAHGLPVAFSRVVYAADGSDDCAFVRKVPALAGLTEEAPASQIVAALAPRPHELILRKTQPSAFLLPLFQVDWTDTGTGITLMAPAGFGSRSNRLGGGHTTMVTGLGSILMDGPGFQQTLGVGRPTTTARGPDSGSVGAGRQGRLSNVGALPGWTLSTPTGS